jgi:hypothetical protein
MDGQKMKAAVCGIGWFVFAAMCGLRLVFAADGLSPRNELATASDSMDPTKTAPSTEPSKPAARLSEGKDEPLSDATVTMTSKWPPPDAVGTLNPLWAIPLSSLAGVQERPLFSPSRRPPPVLAAPVQQPLPPPKSEPDRPLLALMGTIAKGDEGIAILQDETSKIVIRLHTGESHSGWTLTEVKPREATLLHETTSVTLAIPSPVSPPSKS